MTLAQPVTRLILVSRGGVVQSQADGHYSLSGSVITFSDAFNGSERVVVGYQAGADGTVGQVIDTELRTYVAHIMSILDPGGPPPP